MRNRTATVVLSISMLTVGLGIGTLTGLLTVRHRHVRPATALPQQTQWPAAEAVFAGFSQPVIQTDGSQLLVLHGKKLGIRYMADEIDILHAVDFTDVPEEDRVKVMLECARDFVRVVNNILPDWDGAGSSAAAVLSVVKAEDQLLCLWHDGFSLHFHLTDTHRAVVITRKSRSPR